MSDASEARKPETPRSPTSPPGGSISPGYIIALIGSGVGAALVFYMALIGLQATNRLPPPQFMNSLCADSKVEFIRQHTSDKPNLLVVGSSVAWRGFNGEVMEKNAPGVHPLNASFCFFSPNQAAFVADWLIGHHPGIQDVLLMTSLWDFEDCTGKQAAAFNKEDVDDFTYGGVSRWGYYVRYFDPFSLTRNALEFHGYQATTNQLNPIVFDRYGDGPMESGIDNNSRNYGPFDRFDPACFKAVDDLGRKLKGQGRRLLVAVTPLNPDWKSTFDTEGRLVSSFDANLRKLTNIEYWNGDSPEVIKKAGLYDTLHMRWWAAGRYTDALTHAFHFRGGGSAAKGPVSPLAEHG